MDKPKTTLWERWHATDTAVVIDIRFSTDGKWIEKRFCDADGAKAAMNNQQRFSELISLPGTESCSYISERVDTLSRDMVRVLHDVLHVDDVSDFFDCYSSFKDFWAAIKWHEAEWHGARAEAQRLWTAMKNTPEDDMYFGDNHWGNIGFHKDGVVCIDFDEDFYHEPANEDAYELQERP